MPLLPFQLLPFILNSKILMHNTFYMLFLSMTIDHTSSLLALFQFRKLLWFLIQGINDRWEILKLNILGLAWIINQSSISSSFGSSYSIKCTNTTENTMLPCKLQKYFKNVKWKPASLCAYGRSSVLTSTTLQLQVQSPRGWELCFSADRSLHACV